ncbi:MAG: uracil-DNA glycosylase [Acidimicrobiia bacterium]|nr:uracil-DNA glycosylase [Acidimicrobiia bacterium]
MADLGLQLLAEEIIDCRRCPRLVAWREQVAAEKRASFRGQDYWGRPVPGWGDPAASLVVVGLAPAAHGANRTGRMFTGDRSGDWLYRALHEAGFANQPESVAHDDGLTLHNAWVTAPVRCAPPENKPTPAERDNCSEWFNRELDMLTEARVLLALGQYGYIALWRYLGLRNPDLPRPRPKFQHGGEIPLPDGVTILMSFHPSQQNTFTGRLTRDMFAAVFARAKTLSATCS